jgi:flagellar biosynthesis component FlhA
MTPNEIARSIGIDIPDGFSGDDISEEFREAFLNMLTLYEYAGAAMRDEWELKSGEALVCMTSALGVAAGILYSKTKMSADLAEAEIDRLAQLVRINALAHYRLSSLGSAPAAGSA